MTLLCQSWKAVGLRIGDVLELGLGSLNVSVVCQFCAILSHFLTVYHLVTVVDSCCITRSHVFLLFFTIIIIPPLITSFKGDKPDSPGNISMGGTAKRN